MIPISAINGCSAEHWAEVLEILSDAIHDAGFEPNLVSDADDVGIIQKRIVQNLYDNEVVVCDVSARNPNVMFELGMRLAFDKATIIVKDDKTNYTFDTSIIEHLGYPRDLRFASIIDFKKHLSNKIISTHKKAQEDPNHSTFLESFGDYHVAQIQKCELSSEEFILRSLDELKSEIRMFRHMAVHERPEHYEYAEVIVPHMLEFMKKNDMASFAELKGHEEQLIQYIKQFADVTAATVGRPHSLKHTVLQVLTGVWRMAGLSL